jgi:flagellar hook-basal body complex protein FliE
MAINAISTTNTPLDGAVGTPKVGSSPGSGSMPAATSFVDSLGRLVLAAENAGNEANSTIAGMLGGSTDVHEAMIAIQQAEVALQLTVQVRNKLVQAYQEIMRMPI